MRRSWSVENRYAVGNNGRVSLPSDAKRGVGKIKRRPKDAMGTRVYLWTRKNQ